MNYYDEKVQQYFKNLENLLYNELYGVTKNTEFDAQSEFNFKRITTKISVDFFEERVKIFLVFPAKNAKKEKNINEEIEIASSENASKNHLFINEQFEIIGDYDLVKVRGKSHLIPQYLDKEIVKNKDEKTWEMIFYKIFYSDISDEIKKYSNDKNVK